MILHYDGLGGYTLLSSTFHSFPTTDVCDSTRLDATRRLAMQEEKQALEAKLFDM